MQLLKEPAFYVSVN